MAGSFSVDIRKYAEKVERSLDKTCRTIKMSLFDGVIHDTREDTGRLRGNWQTSTGAPKYYTIERFQQDDDMGPATDEMRQNVTAFGVDYMTNNLPYAKVWEERDGMVASNMARIERTVREAVTDA